MSITMKAYLWFRKNVLGIDDRSQLEIAFKNGLTIGKNVTIMDEVIVDPGHCWLIEIGDNVTIAPRVHILAHDASTKRELGYTKIGRVTIGNHVFTGAGGIILPNVHIGNHVVIGAGSVVTHDVPDNSLAVGNPAKVIGTYEEYMEKNHRLMEENPLFDVSYTIENITPYKRDEIKTRLKDSIGYVV